MSASVQSYQRQRYEVASHVVLKVEPMDEETCKEIEQLLGTRRSSTTAAEPHMPHATASMQQQRGTAMQQKGAMQQPPLHAQPTQAAHPPQLLQETPVVTGREPQFGMPPAAASSQGTQAPAGSAGPTMAAWATKLDSNSGPSLGPGATTAPAAQGILGPRQLAPPGKGDSWAQRVQYFDLEGQTFEEDEDEFDEVETCGSMIAQGVEVSSAQAARDAKAALARARASGGGFMQMAPNCGAEMLNKGAQAAKYLHEYGGMDSLKMKGNEGLSAKGNGKQFEQQLTQQFGFSSGFGTYGGKGGKQTGKGKHKNLEFKGNGKGKRHYQAKWDEEYDEHGVADPSGTLGAFGAPEGECWQRVERRRGARGGVKGGLKGAKGAWQQQRGKGGGGGGGGPPWLPPWRGQFEAF